MADSEASASAPPVDGVAQQAEPARPNPVARVIAWALTLKPVRAFLLFTEHRGAMLADSVTYRALFSVFAGVLLGFTIAAAWLSGNPTAWAALIDTVDSAIPGLVGDGGIIDPDDITAPAGLSLAAVVSTIGLVGAAIGAIGSLRAAMRTLADKVRDDVFWIWVLVRNLLLGLGMGAALVVAGIATFAGTAFVGTLNSWLGLGEDDALAQVGTFLVPLLVTFVLDAAVVAVLFIALSGVKASARALIPGALLGGVGLTVLQQLSGLFVGGAGSNPLLASFASLIALLLWFNLSSQVLLIASAYIIVGVDEQGDRVRARFGASTFAQRAVRNAENAVTVATEALRLAREDEARERAGAGSKESAT